MPGDREPIAKPDELLARTSANARKPPPRNLHPWWARLFSWLRAFLGARAARRLLPGPDLARRWGKSAMSLPDDLRELLAELRTESGAVREAIAGAIEDYAHLRDLLLGPGAGSSPVDDVALLAEAEATLRSMLTRASSVAALVAIAARRREDRQGREATGDAVLHLRDQARELSETTSAAIRWTAARDLETAERLRACASRLQRVTARAEGARRATT